MSQDLKCGGCGKHMATLRDAKVRNGMVVYCQQCDTINKRLQALAGCSASSKASVPDFMRGLFK
jgi:hypothetical protein